MSRKKSIRSTESVSSNTSQSTLTNGQASTVCTSQAVSPHISSSRKSSSNINMGSSEEEDKIIKGFLKRCKKLEVDLTKFHAKNHSLAKTNVLRTSILPFLRNSSSIDELFQKNSKVHVSLSNVLLSMLTNWWRAILSSLAPHKTTIASADRNAYLECISRIVARTEWFLTDNDFSDRYSELLVATLEYSIQKLQMLKVVPLSMSAFVGKIFAYSFFYVPKVGNALLFLLNVKQSVMESVQNMFKPQLQTTSNTESLRRLFPVHIRNLVGFTGVAKIPKKRRSFINCVPPPQHPVDGIKEPRGYWIRRWFSCDSDVFNSFLRHYITIVKRFVDDDSVDFDLLFTCPGFPVLIGHLLQIFTVSIDKISLTTIGKQIPDGVPPNYVLQSKANIAPPLINDSGIKLQESEMCYNSIIKIFKVVRDVSFSSPHKLNREFVSSIDHLLVSIAKTIPVFEHNRNGLILNITYEFIHYTESEVNWEFWLSCNYMMLKNTDHIQVLVKSLAFLFNVWSMIPESLSQVDNDSSYLAWFTNPNQSFKLNFTKWLISNENFERFFTHWHPLVRSYYIRLLVWRLIGVNNYESSNAIRTTKIIERKLTAAYELLQVFDQKSNLNFKPDNVMVNRRFTIVPIASKEEFSVMNTELDLNSSYHSNIKSSELKKTHPYEIFDEAIYSCSSLPRSTSSENVANNRSLVSSIGKLFKILSNETSSKEKTDGLSKKSRNSVSLTSLSAYSTMSRSSSPSIMSFNSAPTSVTDLSNGSSIASESDNSSISSEVIVSDPPEIIKSPPEIVRPLYKFQLMVDHESMSDKYAIVNSKVGNKFGVNRSPERLFPEKPTLPSVSIFEKNVQLNTFYIENDVEFLDGEIDDFGESMEFGDNEMSDESSETELFSSLDSSPRNLVKWTNLGKSLIELQMIINEFKQYLKRRSEIDRFNSNLSGSDIINEFDYLKSIIPFLSVDGSTDFKLLNAG